MNTTANKPRTLDERADAAERYFLPRDYVANPVMSPEQRPEEYWNANRIKNSQRYQFEVYRIAQHIAVARSAKTVLDFGCGVGNKLVQFFDDRFHTVGIDLPATISVCRRMFPNRSWQTDDLSHPSFAQSAEQNADIIVCADVIEHLASPEHLLNEMKKVSSQTTRLIISTPERHRLLNTETRKPSNPEHVREWTAEELSQLLKSCGWSVIKQTVTLPFRMGLNRQSARYVWNRVRTRSGLRTCQIAVCEVAT